MATKRKATTAETAAPTPPPLTPRLVEYAKPTVGDGGVETAPIRAAIEALTGLDASEGCDPRVRVACTVLGLTVAALNNRSKQGDSWLEAMSKAVTPSDRLQRARVLYVLDQVQAALLAGRAVRREAIAEALCDVDALYGKLTPAQISGALERLKPGAKGAGNWALEMVAADLTLKCGALGARLKKKGTEIERQAQARARINELFRAARRDSPY